MKPPATEAANYAQYPQLLALAEESVREDGGIVDPVKMRRYGQTIGRRGRDWAISVLGHARLGLGPGGATLTEMHLLLIADEHDVTPPLPEHIAAARAASAAKELAQREKRIEALGAEWAALRQALPVVVTCEHNYQSRHHCDGYVQGADHIVVHADLRHGRLARLAFEALCETPSNRRQLYFPFSHLENLRDGGGFPSCKACIRHACTITGLAAPTMLGNRSGR